MFKFSNTPLLIKTYIQTRYTHTPRASLYYQRITEALRLTGSETVLEIGGLLNADLKAKALVGELRARIQRIARLVAQARHKPRVFFQIGLSPIVSAGTGTFIHELVVRAGGVNLAQGPVTYPRFSQEQVLALAPDVIIITSMARGAVFKEVKT